MTSQGSIFVRSNRLYIRLHGRRISTGFKDDPTGWGQARKQLDLLVNPDGVEGTFNYTHVAHEFLEEKALKSSRTYEAYNLALRKFGVGSRSMVSAFTVECDAKSLRSSGLSPNTINNYIRHMDVFLKWSHERHGAPKVSLKQYRLRVVRVPKQAWSLEEVRAVAKSARECVDDEFADFILFLAYTGGRVRESLLVQEQHIRKHTLTFPGGKGREEYNSIPMHAPLREIVDNRLADMSRPPYLFRWRPQTHSRLRRHLVRAAEHARVEYVSFHGLRRTFVTYLFEQGLQPDVVMQLARHASLATTMNHYRVFKQEKLGETMSELFV